MNTYYKLSILLILCFFVKNLWADDEPLFNQVNLQAQAHMEIPNDELQVIMAVETEDKDAARLAQTINVAMKWALSKAKSDEGIQIRTLSYNTHPIYDKRTVIGWRASQQLEIKGSEIAEITELSGELQEKLQIKSMRFNPSRLSRQKFEDELIEQALEAFKQRVELVKKHMDEKNVRIVNLNINTNNYYPQPVYAESRMMSMKADTAPAVEAGTSNLTVTVSGSVQYF